MTTYALTYRDQLRVEVVIVTPVFSGNPLPLEEVGGLSRFIKLTGKTLIIPTSAIISIEEI